ncbi:MAG: hypothetical protein A2496_23830 [Burkholderiales bacterium RIFOXYC12_FULL_60_6]|nr:MAG: hypothetical protein A2496_23830 [Burkholderiales bacterium RIFOXYC12_FULL_60_6]
MNCIPGYKKLTDDDEVLFTVGSLDRDAVRIGLYKRTGSILPARLGFVRIPVDSVEQLISGLNSFMEQIEECE